MAYRDVSWGDVGYYLGDEERAEARGAVAEDELTCFVVVGLDASNACAPDDADASFVFVVEVEVSIVDGLVGSYYGILREEVHFAGVFAESFCGVEILDFAGEPGLEFGGIEVCYGSGSTHTVSEALPGVGEVVAQGRDGT